MIKTLTRHGNSMAIVIEKPILELLKITPDTPLDISTDGHILTITPVLNQRKAKIQKALGEVHKEYGKTLKNLAR